jgi:tetratricopeptide (TPR) repeat protein
LQALAGVPRRPVRRNPQPVAVFTYAGRPLAEIDAVLAVTRHAVLDAADPRPARMNLAEAHQLRFTRTGDVADLTDAVGIVREVLAATPTGDPARSGRLTTLASFLQIRFAATGNRDDLEETIAAYAEALDSAADDDEDEPMYRSNLGRARLTRYAYVSADPDDLDAAITLIGVAVAATPAGETGRDLRLYVLHQAYRMRFARTGNRADLDAAVEAAREAVDETPPPHPERPERLLDLGATHLARGHREDAAAATEIARGLMKATPRDHPLYKAARDLLGRAGRPPGVG